MSEVSTEYRLAMKIFTTTMKLDSLHKKMAYREAMDTTPLDPDVKAQIDKLIS